MTGEQSLQVPTSVKDNSPTPTRSLRDTPRAGRFPRWFSPVTIWAGLGVLGLITQGIVFGRWISDGHLHWLPRDTEIPAIRQVVVWGGQVGIVGFILITSVVLWRRCRRAKTVTFDTAIFVGWMLVFWTEPLLNYRHLMATLNRAALSVPAWGNYIPLLPTDTYPAEPILIGAGLSYSGMILWYWGQWRCLTTLLHYKPHWGTLRLLPILIILGVVVDLVIEVVVVRGLTFYAYLRFPGPALFDGHWYRLPYGAALINGTLMATPMTLMRYLAVRDRHQPHIFRGDNAFSPRTAGWLRLCSGVGFLTLVAFLWVGLYITAVAIFGLAPMPPDVPHYLQPSTP
jgi:hypothetical protein